MVGIFDCGGVLGKYEIRLKERKVVNMEALNTYKTEKTLAEQMNERLAEMKMTKAEAALKMNYSRAALSQYLNGKYASDPTELEKKVREFLAATGGVAEGQEPENSVPTGAGTLKKKVEFFESRDFVQTIGVCQACQEYMGLGIIVGKSGQGKTHALKKYAELPRVAYIECDDTMACRDLVEAIENGIGLPKGYGGTIWSRVNRIREFFNTNEGFLLIIDEADKLINKYTQKKMEILRGIFDQSNVGIVIAGEPRLETELKGNLARFANTMDFYYKKRRYCRMATKSVITKIRRKKMAEASHTTGTVAKITHIALGSGGVNADGTVIVPLAENVALKKEVVRKPYTSSTKTSDTSYEYTIKLEEDELVGTFISEMALIDEDGDVVAFSNFLAKGKDETEVTFTIEDNY